MPPVIRVVTAEICRGGRYLITRRGPQAVFPGLWEFPGGRVRPAETDEEALRRCLGERLGVTATVHERVLVVQGRTPERHVDMVVYRVDVQGDPHPLRVADLAWVPADELGRYEFPGADRETLEALLGESDGT